MLCGSHVGQPCRRAFQGTASLLLEQRTSGAAPSIDRQVAVSVQILACLCMKGLHVRLRLPLLSARVSLRAVSLHLASDVISGRGDSSLVFCTNVPPARLPNAVLGVRSR